MPRKVTKGKVRKVCRICQQEEDVYAGTGLCRPCANKDSRERRAKQRAEHPPMATCECGATYLSGRGIRRCHPCTITYRHRKQAEWAARGNARNARVEQLNDKACRTRNAQRYGMTLAEYDNLCAKAILDGCAICGGQVVKEEDGRFRRPSFDHCHVTGKVRGVLCRSCNSMLGLAHDNPAILRAGADYIELHRKMSAM